MMCNVFSAVLVTSGEGYNTHLPFKWPWIDIFTMSVRHLCLPLMVLAGQKCN